MIYVEYQSILESRSTAFNVCTGGLFIAGPKGTGAVFNRVYLRIRIISPLLSSISKGIAKAP
jgi:hypothetical protein